MKPSAAAVLANPLPVTRRAALPALAALAASAGTAWAQTTPQGPLSIALAPFLSPAALLAVYNPLRQHLTQALGRPVEMLTARDFRTLMDAARNAEHEVVQLPAHLARLAMADWGWRMLAAPAERVTVLVAVKDGSPLRTPADLRGRSVAMLDPLSLTATVGRRWLELNGLAGATTVQTMPSINSMLFALDRDEVAAFVAADTQLNSLPSSTPRGERVLARVSDIAGPIFVARPTLPAPEVAALQAAMASFTPDPGRPRTAANSTLRPLDAAGLAALDGYLAIARSALSASSPRQP